MADKQYRVNCRYCSGSGKHPIVNRAKCRECGGRAFWYVPAETAREFLAAERVFLEVENYAHINMETGVCFASWLSLGVRQYRLQGAMVDESAAVNFVAAYIAAITLIHRAGGMTCEKLEAEIIRARKMIDAE